MPAGHEQRMQTGAQQFNVNELFDSLPDAEQDKINCAIRENGKSREEERYARLQAAEIAKNEFVQEFELIKYEIAENDDWFVAAKEGRVDVTPQSLNQHKRKAEELYSRKKSLIDSLLPKADLRIKDVISQIETEEAREALFQRRDLERLLQPFYEERECERRQVLAAQTRERIRQREEEEARRREEYEALLNRLHAEELERKRILAEALRRKRAEDIRAHVHARKIPYLVHFTPIGNVESILRNGLRSRNALAGQQFVFTDEHRSDGWLNWISTSITFPNYKMFYAKKKSLNDINGWAILLIKRDVLWELDCKFILTNAASFGIRMFRDDKWSSAEAFEDMFNYAEHRNGIPDFYTTDPQAEVMIRDEVPRHYIVMIALERQADAKQLGNLEYIRVETIPELFKWRSDYEHWRQFRLSPFPAGSDLVAPF